MKARRYAEGTTVSVEKTRNELERLLAHHGAVQRLVFTDDESGRAVIQFRISDRMAKLTLAVKMPPLVDKPRGWWGWTLKKREDWELARREQFERESWRRLLLLTKAKLEAIADGVSSFEREFLSDLMLPNGKTVHEEIADKLVSAYQTATTPFLLESHNP